MEWMCYKEDMMERERKKKEAKELRRKKKETKQLEEKKLQTTAVGRQNPALGKLARDFSMSRLVGSR